MLTLRAPDERYSWAMKILLVGNYANANQVSMRHFATLLRDLLTRQDDLPEEMEVRLIHPEVLLGRVWQSESGIGKWLGYIDVYLLFPFWLRRAARWADLVHVCDQSNSLWIRHLARVPHLITCHDLIAIRSALGEVERNPVSWTGRLYQSLVLKGLERARCVICVSDHTRKQLLEVSRLPASRIRLIPLALNYPYGEWPVQRTEPFMRELGLVGRRFFLHVGGNQFYKNRLGVLAIFRILAQSEEEFVLVMVGKRWTAPMRALVREHGLQDRVFEVVDCSSETLCALYNRAEALIFPSLMEGFGWPILEAQACGCPVATTNAPPMTETGGAGAVYLDPDRPQQAADAILGLIEARADYIVRGQENLRRFSAEQMREGYLDAYRSLLNQRA